MLNDIVTGDFDETVSLYFVFIVLVGISHCSSHIVRFRVSVPLVEKKKKSCSDFMERRKNLRQLGGPLGYSI